MTQSSGTVQCYLIGSQNGHVVVFKTGMIVELCGARQMLHPKMLRIIIEIRYRVNSDDFDI